MLRNLGGIAAATALPFVRFVANNGGERIPILRFLTWWAVFTSLGAVAVILIFRSRGNGQARAGSVAIAVTLVVFFYAVAVRDALRLDQIHGIDGSLWVGAALIVGLVLAVRSDVVVRAIPYVAMVLVSYTAVEALVTWSSQGHEVPSSEYGSTLKEPKKTMNIYWLVLDGYARADVLREIGERDPEELIRGLEDRDFQVDRYATAPFPVTTLSLSSTLLMDFAVKDPSIKPYGGWFHPMIQSGSTVVATLRRWGYNYALFPGGGWNGSQCTGAEDTCLAPSWVTEEERALSSMTLLGLLPGIADRTNDLAAADQVDPTVAVRRMIEADLPAPTFFFAHILSPHPPFYRSGQQCRAHDATPEDQWGPPSLYLEVVACLNGQVLKAVDELLAHDPDAIVILQSDHGPAIGWDPNADTDWTPDQIRMRFGTLLAARLTSGCVLPQESNTVNVFRTVLSCLTGSEPEHLPGRNWVFNYSSRTLTETTVPTP